MTESPSLPGAVHVLPDGIRYRVDTSVYSREALFRACYQFTDRCYLFLHHDEGDAVTVDFRRRSPAADLAAVVGDFANELINQKVREDVARETRVLRELIVAKAFAGMTVRPNE
jgi:His-Xaa-Ser system protein HxsD